MKLTGLAAVLGGLIAAAVIPNVRAQTAPNSGHLVVPGVARHLGSLPWRGLMLYTTAMQAKRSF